MGILTMTLLLPLTWVYSTVSERASRRDGAVLGGLRQAASVCAALATLYSFLYLLLRLEEYALLAGSVALFMVPAQVMFITRRMTWHELKLGGESWAVRGGQH